MCAQRRSRSRSTSSRRSRKAKRTAGHSRRKPKKAAARRKSTARRKPKKAAARRKGTARRKPKKTAARRKSTARSRKPARPRSSGRSLRPAAASPRAVDFISWLRGQGIAFESRKHAEVYTAQEVAAVSRVSGYDMAKVVVLEADDSCVLAVLPAPLRVDLDAARSALGARRIALASEAGFERLFPGCERGAMPPFGNLWGLKTYVDESLASHPRIVFNAGSHIETVTMAYRDFERLARPVRVRLAAAVHA